MRDRVACLVGVRSVLNDACLPKFAAIDFTGYAVAPLFGTTDAWENTP